MPEWEYKAEGCHAGQYYDSFEMMVLTPLGSEGWELMHVTERPSDGGAVDDVHLKGYFKRLKPQGDTDA